MTESWNLHIGLTERAGVARYAFSLVNAEGGGLVHRTQTVAARVRSGIAQPPTSAAAVDAWLERTGRAISNQLFHPEIRQLIASIDGYLAIATGDADIPWELASMRDGYLARRLPVARSVEARAPQEDPAPAGERQYMRVLIVTNPSGDLDSAAREGGEIEELLRSEQFIDVTRLDGDDATLDAVGNVLSDARFDVFHYAGHVTRGDDGQDQLELSGGEPGTTDWLAGLFSVHPPELAFVNGCQSGKPARPGETSVDKRPIAGMAQAFLSVGVRAYVGTLWDVPDTAARLVAASFYREVLRQSPLGKALTSARDAVDAEGPVAWAAYMLFGRPDHLLDGIRQAIERGQDLSRLVEMMGDPDQNKRRRAAILLGERAYPPARDSLVEALDDDDRSVGWRAVLALAKIGTPAAVEPLLELLQSADASLAIHVLVMLRECLSPLVSPAIRQLIDSTEDRVVRATGLITLGGAGDPANVDLFAGYLDQPDQLMQLLAIEGLARVGLSPTVDDRVRDDVLRRLEAARLDEDVLVAARRRALDALWSVRR